MGMEDDFCRMMSMMKKTIEYIKNYLPQELKRSSLTTSSIIFSI